MTFKQKHISCDVKQSSLENQITDHKTNIAKLKLNLIKLEKRGKNDQMNLQALQSITYKPENPDNPDNPDNLS